jgi:hypothetical protein
MLTDKAMLYIKQNGYKEFISLKDDTTTTPVKTAKQQIQEYAGIDNEQINYDRT